MANFNSLKATIDAQIKANGVQAITGPILNAVLTAMINTIGNGYTLQGSVAQTTDNPGSPDNPVAYLAAGPGTYTNFGGTVIPDDGHAYLLTWDTSWHAVQLPLATFDLVDSKANASDVYTKVQTDALLDLKADKATTYTKSETDNRLNDKVDKVAGKGLSSNDYTDAEKAKLGALPTATELSTDLATKQDKDADAVAGNVAVMNAGGSSEDGGVALTDLATKSEVAILAGEAGLAEAVIDTDGAGTEQEFTFRKSGGDGGAYYRKIKGKTLAWNQFQAISSSDLSKGESGITITDNRDGSYTISGTASAEVRVNLPSLNVVNGHKYMIAMSVAGSNSTFGLRSINTDSFGANNGWTYQSAVFTYTNVVAGEILSLRVINGAVISTPVRLYVQVYDLTRMFGAGNEPSTVADFEALYPEAYYPYNPGTLISNDAEAVETTGRNQYNPATGKARVIGGQTYYIGGTYTSLSQDGVAITPAGDGTFTPASTGEVDVVGGNATDTIINLSDADNGLWQPYWERTLQLGITTREDTDGNVPFPNGLQSCPVAQDEATKEGGIIRVGTRAYQAGDESDANVITDGTNTNYALATPVPFAWAEPLNLGVKVDENGTERAVAPEGATEPSAPFVADTTYTMSVARMVAILQGI